MSRIVASCASSGSAPGRAAVQRLLERVRARGGHERAQDLSAVESDLDPHEADRQPLDTTSVRTPWTAPGWTNATSARRDRAAVLVDQLRAGGLELASVPSTSGPRARVVHARAATGEEAPDGRVLARRREKLHAAVADEQRHRLDALLRERVAMLDRGAEQALVGRDRLVEVATATPR